MAELHAGQAFYSGDPRSDDISAVRDMLQDVLPADFQFNDREIQAVIDQAQGSTPRLDHIGISTATVVSAASAGARTLTLTAAGLEDDAVLDAGDTFLIAGQTQRYTVASRATVSGGNLADVAIWPALVTAVAATTVVTIRLFNVKLAAAIACGKLARRWMRESDVSVDGRSISHSQKSRQAFAMEQQFRLEARAEGRFGGALPVVRT